MGRGGLPYAVSVVAAWRGRGDIPVGGWNNVQAGFLLNQHRISMVEKAQKTVQTIARGQDDRSGCGVVEKYTDVRSRRARFSLR